MYKLLIVDDEKSIRDRLGEIDWSEFEIGEVLFAEHGMAGLRKVYSDRPDFILTDIQMPVMDGIAMLQQVHNHFPGILSVVLTGYDDFEYVRECMRNEVVDYVLKPINVTELGNIFRRVLKRKKENENERDAFEALRLRTRDMVLGMRNRFLKQYFSRPMTSEEIQEASAYAELELEGNTFSCMIFRPDIQNTTPADFYGEEFELVLFALDNVFSDILEKKEAVCARVNEKTLDVCVLIARSMTKKEAEFFCESVKERLYSVAQLWNTTFSCAMGVEVASNTDILRSIKSAELTLQARHEEDAFLIANPNMNIPETPSASGEKRIYTADPANMKLITRAALEYIDKNFQSAITLDDVADHVFLSSAYVSSLFKSEVKMNFITYLTMKRIEKAKELLANPRLKIYEISTEIGYENSRYFSAIFKRYTGQTPVEFRSGMGLREEV